MFLFRLFALSCSIKLREDKPTNVHQAMDSQTNQLHFIMFPIMAQGHMIPMVDIAKMFAQREVIITIVTTPHNAARFKETIERATLSGLQIRVIQLNFPCEEAGLPKGCENFDMLPSPNLAFNLFTATAKLQEPAEKLIKELVPPPSCIISDFCLPWTINIARKFHMPRVTFHATSCFTILCTHILNTCMADQDTIPKSDSDYFVVPGLPDRIEITRAQIPGPLSPNLIDFCLQMKAADKASHGVILNSFDELEMEYVKEYNKVKRVWCIGPASLCDNMVKVQRGNKSAIDEYQCLKWLESWEPNSVLYACLGSLCNLASSQLIELGLGLEASNKPFIWVIRGGKVLEELENWIVKDGFEERIKTRGLVIQGWAPQLLILSHPAIGGFLTHGGWNSILEGVCYGLPMVTWPLFGDQFLGERLVENVLNIGTSIGVEEPVKWDEEERSGVLVEKDQVKRAVERVMDGGEESKAIRERARKFGEMANRAIEEGGSSNVNLTLFIQYIMQLAQVRPVTKKK